MEEITGKPVKFVEIDLLDVAALKTLFDEVWSFVEQNWNTFRSPELDVAPPFPGVPDGGARKPTRVSSLPLAVRRCNRGVRG